MPKENLSSGMTKSVRDEKPEFVMWFVNLITFSNHVPKGHIIKCKMKMAIDGKVAVEEESIGDIIFLIRLPQTLSIAWTGWASSFSFDGCTTTASGSVNVSTPSNYWSNQ